MTTQANTAAAASTSADAAEKNPFVERFGTLIDVTDRVSAKGPYITFKLQGTKRDGGIFDVYGSCFNADVIAQMKDAVGQGIWTKGPIEKLPNNKTSFKVIYFKLTAAKADEAPVDQAASESANA
jgi:hypothetical protein